MVRVGAALTHIDAAMAAKAHNTRRAGSYMRRLRRTGLLIAARLTAGEVLIMA
jgi:hypothetical protein